MIESGHTSCAVMGHMIESSHTSSSVCRPYYPSTQAHISRVSSLAHINTDFLCIAKYGVDLATISWEEENDKSSPDQPSKVYNLIKQQLGNSLAHSLARSLSLFLSLLLLVSLVMMIRVILKRLVEDTFLWEFTPDRKCISNDSILWLSP